MSDKFLKIFVLSFLTVALVVGGILLVRAKNKKDALALITNIENPFGIESDDVSLEGNEENNENENANSENNGEGQPIQTDFVSINQNSVVKQLGSEPVAGATFVTFERPLPLPEPSAENVIEGYDFTGYPSLQFGADQKEVADLKTVLNRQNPSPGLVVDNAFDTNLKNAVVDFQTRNGLTPDGVVGKGTYAKLNSFQGIVPQKPVTPEMETVEAVRFVDRANGYVYDKPIYLDESAILVSNTPVYLVYEAYFSKTKSSFLARYLRDNTVENLVGTISMPNIKPLPGVKNIGTLSTKLLANTITFVSPVKQGEKLFYLAKSPSGTDGFLYDFKTAQSKKIWSSSFSEWIPEAVNEESVVVTTRASGRAPGYAYMVNTKTGSMTALLSNIPGLTTSVSPDGKKVVYSSYENATLKTSVLTVASSVISDMAPTTLPEKCVWTKDSKYAYCGGPSAVIPATYPDDWYAGEISFSDALWKIDMTTNTSKIVLNQANMPVGVDMTRLVLNEKENYLVFINKSDQLLYGIDLSKL